MVDMRNYTISENVIDFFFLFIIYRSISSTRYTLIFTLDAIPVPRNLVYDTGLDGPAADIARIAGASRASERECAATG